MAVIAPADIGDGGAGVNGAEVFALRRNDQHAARAGGEQVASSIELKAVTAAAFAGGAPRRATVKRRDTTSMRSTHLEMEVMGVMKLSVRSTT